MTRNAELTLFLYTPITILESMTLTLLQFIVFGPDSGGAEHYRNTGDKLWFRGDHAEYELLEEVLNERSWNNDRFSDNRNSPEVQALMDFMVRSQLGTFEDHMEALLAKVTKIELR